MNIFEIILLSTIISIMVGLLSYRLGVYCERKAWNGLIVDGIIPKPNKKGG